MRTTYMHCCHEYYSNNVDNPSACEEAHWESGLREGALSSCPPTHSLTELPRKLWCALFKILQLFSPNLRTKCLHVLQLKLWCRLKTLNLLLDFDCSSHIYLKIIKFLQRRVNKTLCVVILEKGFMLPSVLPSVPHLIPQSGSFFWPLFHQYLC